MLDGNKNQYTHRGWIIIPGGIIRALTKTVNGQSALSQNQRETEVFNLPLNYPQEIMSGLESSGVFLHR